MPKTKISEFSATPANNTDIDSINIAEGCAPSGINDAIRELMSQLKDFQTGAQGDSFNGPIGSSTPAAGAFTTLSASSTLGVTGVATLGAGAILNTPASVTLTNATGLPIATGVSGLGTGVATFLATPSSANLRSALTDETGTGSAVFATSPTLVTPALGTPSSGVVTNLTGTASININGTVGATTPTTGAFTTATTSARLTVNGNLENTAIFGNNSSDVGVSLAILGSSTSTNWAIYNNYYAAGRLDIVPSSTAGGTIFSTPIASFASTGLTIAGSTTSNSFIPSSATVPTNGMYLPSANNVAFAINSAEGMRLNSTGLGIGTSSPSYKLDVEGNFRQSNYNSGSLNGYFGCANTGSITLNFGGTTTPAKGRIFYSDNSDLFAFYTNSTEKMRIDTSGNVGIGTTSPFAKLSVTTTNGNFGISNGNTSGGTKIQAFGTSTSSDGYLAFEGNSIEYGRFNTSGNFVARNIGVGSTTPTTSGTGITFPATQSASSDANTLDDYEEGTWTPTITFGGASVGVTYNTTFTGATYTKIGNRVCVSGYLEVTNKGSSTGDASIGNLPFTSESGATKYLGATVGGSSFTFANQFWARIAAASTTIDLLETTEAGAQSFITNSDFANGTSIYFSATYTV